MTSDSINRGPLGTKVENTRLNLNAETSSLPDLSTETAFFPVRRQRPTPPLFDTPHISTKQQREDDEEAEPLESAPKNLLTNDSMIRNHDQILIHLIEPTTTTSTTTTSSAAAASSAKRKRSEDVDTKPQDLIEQAPQPKRPRVFEVIDLTDD